MPKEAVYGTIATADEGREPIAEVCWSKDVGHVQVVTRRKGYEVASLGEDVISCDYGLYVDLDRRGINMLIRNLRRARDQAFGRDE